MGNGIGLSIRIEMCEIMGAWGIIGKLDTRSARRYAWNFSGRESWRSKGRNGKADALFNFVYYATDNCTHL